MKGANETSAVVTAIPNIKATTINHNYQLYRISSEQLLLILLCSGDHGIMINLITLNIFGGVDGKYFVGIQGNQDGSSVGLRGIRV